MMMMIDSDIEAANRNTKQLASESQEMKSAAVEQIKH